MDERRFLKKALLVLKIAGCYGLAIIAIAVVGRVADVYASLARVHVLLGAVFLLLITAPLAVIIWQVAVLWVSIPATVRPPSIGLYQRSAAQYAKKCVSFSRLVVANLLGNPNLDDRDRAQLKAAVPALVKRIADHADFAPDDLQQFWEEQTGAIFDKLDRIAEKNISRSAVFTSLGTAASRNTAIDALIQIYQMAALTTAIVKVYWTRPGIMVALGLGRDILAAAGGVVLVSEITTGTYFKKLTAFATKAGNKIPGINILTGFLDEGIQAGVSWGLVRRYGKTVMKRCRAIEWNSASERRQLVAAVSQPLPGGVPADNRTIRQQVCAMLRNVSWCTGRQNVHVAMCAVDYILAAFSDPQEQGRLIGQLRQKPHEGRTLLDRAMFWKKWSGAGESTAALNVFLACLDAVPQQALAAEEREFVMRLQNRQPTGTGLGNNTV